MNEIVFDSYNFNAKDCCIRRNIIYLDIIMVSEKDMKDFIEFYRKHSYGNGIFSFAVDGKEYSGWCGMIRYDNRNNIRLCLAIADDDDEEASAGQNIFASNIIKVLNTHKRAIENVTNLLMDKKVISESEKHSLLNELWEGEYDQRMFEMVDDLQKYLKDGKETMEDLRKK